MAKKGITKKIASISFNEGVNTKTDDKQLTLESFLSLENCTFNKIGKITKRKGMEKMSKDIMLGGDMESSTGADLMTFQDQLLSFNSEDFSYTDAGTLYQYINDSSQWQQNSNKKVLPITASEEPLLRGVITGNEQKVHRNQDMVIQDGIICSVYTSCDPLETAAREVRCSIIDESTGIPIRNDFLVGTGFNSHVIYADGYFFVFYLKGTYGSGVYNLAYSIISVATPYSTLVSGSGIITGIESAQIEIVQSILDATEASIVYSNSSGDTLIRGIDLNGSVAFSGAAQTLLATNSGRFCLFGDATGGFRAVVHNNSTYVLHNYSFVKSTNTVSTLSTLGAYNGLINLVPFYKNGSFATPQILITRSMTDYTNPSVTEAGAYLGSTYNYISKLDYNAGTLEQYFIKNSSIISKPVTYNSNSYFLVNSEQEKVYKLTFENSDVDTSGNEVTFPGSNIATGVPVVMCGPTGIIPTGLTLGTTYYAINNGDKIGFALTLNDAIAGTKVSITTTGPPVVMHIHILQGSNNFESTNYFYDQDGNVLGKFTESNAGTLFNTYQSNTTGKLPYYDIGYGKLSRPSNSSTEIYMLATENVKPLDFNFKLDQLNMCKVNFDVFQDKTYRNTETDNSLIIASNLVNKYDGNELSEQGFNYFPYNITFLLDPANPGNMTTGTYSYAVFYSYVDKDGLLVRGAPIFDTTTIDDSNVDAVTIIIPLLPHTNKDQDKINIEVYRTEESGTIYYKVDSYSQYYAKGTLAYNLWDGTSDADLVSGEILYTTGGVLDSGPVPTATLIENFQDRIFLAGLKSPNKLAFSKIKQEGIDYEFNELLYVNFPQEGGDISTIKAMDDKLIVFKENRIYMINGDGPNNLGQGAFALPTLVSSELGCISARSAVLTDIGIMFQTSKGYYLLSRGLQVTPIGIKMDEYKDLTISSAVVIPDSNQVRFTSSDNDAPILVYDTLINQWSIFTNGSATYGAVIYQGVHHKVDFTGTVHREYDGYLDHTTEVIMKLKTSHIQMAGLQGFQRAYNLLVLGEYYSEHDLTIKIYYDFDTVAAQTETLTISADPNPYQKRINFNRQRCQAIQIEIYGDGAAQGFDLSNLNVLVGLKSNHFKPIQGS